MPTDIDGLKERFLPHGVPEGATPVSGHTAADVTSATGIALVGMTAPGAGNAFFFTEIISVNQTAAETPILVLQDEDDVPFVFFIPADAAGDNGTLKLTLSPPIKSTTNKAMEVAALTTVGDSRAVVNGYDGTA